MLNVPGKKRWLAVPRLFVGLIDVVDVARVEVELVVDVDKLVKKYFEGGQLLGNVLRLL